MSIKLKTSFTISEETRDKLQAIADFEHRENRTAALEAIVDRAYVAMLEEVARRERALLRTQLISGDGGQ